MKTEKDKSSKAMQSKDAGVNESSTNIIEAEYTSLKPRAADHIRHLKDKSKEHLLKAGVKLRDTKEKWQSSSFKSFLTEAKAFLFSSTLEESKYRKKIEKDLEKQIKPAVFFGILTIGIGVGFFVVWGGLAPLDSASTAGGSIVLAGNHKAVQSLEGGIVKSIFVEEGQYVEEDQDLIKLDDVNARASKEIYLSQLRFAKALEARLIAEQEDADEVDFSDPILQSSDAETKTIINNQRSLFELTREALKRNIEMLDQRILQKSESINAYEARRKSLIAQQAIAKEQLGISKDLHSKGLEQKTRLLSFQDRYEEIDGNIHSLNSQIASDREAIAETEINKIYVRNDFKQKNAESYKQNRAQLLEIEQKLYSAEDALRRTLIKAPTSGIVTGLVVHTIGAVIPPQGQKIMDIVPQNDELIVECYIDPKDIESIYVGLDAKVQLNAYKARLVPRIAGTVTYVSADKFDRQTADGKGSSFYLAKVKLSQKSIASVNTDIKLYPGMPVAVFIVKGTRTFLEYIISPIRDSFHKAFKEP